MYGSLDISASGMVAQRARMNAAAANIAGREATLTEDGRLVPYRERQVMIASGDPSSRSRDGRALGVHVADIVESQAQFPLKWDPGNPHAFKDGPKAGYVPTSNVDLFKQIVDQMDASRAYEANVVAAEATKSMMASALRLLA